MSDNCFDILKEYESVIKVFLPSFSSPEAMEIDTDLTLRLSYILSTSEPQNMFGILKLPKVVTSDIKVITSNKDYVIPKNKTDTKYMLSRLGYELTIKILKFKSLFGDDVKNAIVLVNEIKNNCECFSIKQLNICGNDLIELGYKGAEIGNILNNILDVVINDKVKNTKNDLLNYVKNEM